MDGHELGELDPRKETGRHGPAEELLKVVDLCKHFPIQAGFWRRIVGYVRAVDGVSFALHRGETFGLVGESGCGQDHDRPQYSAGNRAYVGPNPVQRSGSGLGRRGHT